MEAVEYRFKDALQASYLNSNNGVETAMVNVVELAIGQVYQSGRALRE